MADICPICGRKYGGEMQNHHLIPVTYSTRDSVTRNVHDPSNLVRIHKMCHQKIHSTFCEGELLIYYNTIENILEHEEIQKFVKWIRKKPADYYDKNDDTKHRKKKRKK